jgi:hypothetical protein
LTIGLQTCILDPPRFMIFSGIPSPGATWEGTVSGAPQLAQLVKYVPREFEADDSLPSHPQTTTAVSCPLVLLVGRNGSWGATVLKSFEKFGSALSYVAPQTVTTEYVRSGAFQLILLDSTVSTDQRRQLATELAGSNVSIFYTFPVENGCWWLPALRCGLDCHGAPAFRRNEFPQELERILQIQTEA